jgi:Ca2+:H+ antiporter
MAARLSGVTLQKADIRLFALSAVAIALAGVFRFVDAGRVVPFVVAGLALALLAMLVGRSVEALGDRLGPGATGVVQSGLGNLPELFVSIFALRAGLNDVVLGSIVGSVLGNVLLILGLAFVVGGVKHGPQKFGAEQGRMAAMLLAVAVGAIAIPSLTSALHTPAAGHEVTLSNIVAIGLLIVFGLSLPAAMQKQPGTAGGAAEARHSAAHADHADLWPLGFAIGMLALSGVGAAFVSEWFVHALEPAIQALHISQAFAGLVIVAIAGNAIENVVGIQLAARNQADYAVSVILQSPLQIVLVVAPLLVLLSHVVAPTALTLVFPPLLLAALLVTVLVAVIVVLDGESTWLEGAGLLLLYCVIAAAFWWG